MQPHIHTCTHTHTYTGFGMVWDTFFAYLIWVMNTFKSKSHGRWPKGLHRMCEWHWVCVCMWMCVLSLCMCMYSVECNATWPHLQGRSCDLTTPLPPTLVLEQVHVVWWSCVLLPWMINNTLKFHRYCGYPCYAIQINPYPQWLPSSSIAIWGVYY